MARSEVKYLFIGVLACVFSIGCQQSRAKGLLEAASLGEPPIVLQTSIQEAFCVHDADRGTSFVLSDIPIDKFTSGTINQGQFIHIDLLWLPKPGATPMDSSATNASIRYVIFSNGEIGIYGGAGFVTPHDELGGSSVTLTVERISLQLLESTDGFVDLLSPAHLTGSFRSIRDNAKAHRLHTAATRTVREFLGRLRFVRTQDTRKINS